MNSKHSNLNQAYQQALDRLNQHQRTAVETIEGPVMVLAGPGTGKTQVLALRIAHILQKTDTAPNSILALTFTESAAITMRQRLVSLIGSTAHYVTITTFHSFCQEIMQLYPDHFELSVKAQALSDIERFQIMETILDEQELEVLKPPKDTLHYLRDCLRAVSDLKRENVSIEDFERLIEDETRLFETESEELTKSEFTKQSRLLAKWRDLLIIYRQYQQKLTTMDRFDFDDMIMKTLHVFKTNEVVLSQYQEQYQYILVDEYQDTNTSQNALVQKLAEYWGEQANVFVVGDPNQSIYRFQGASLENTLQFVQQYPEATVIQLDIGYRCPQGIYAGAAGLMQQSRYEVASAQPLLEQLQKPLTSAHETNSQSAPITLYESPAQTIELLYVAEKIQNLLTQGVDPQEIAILYRNNQEVIEIERVLTAWNIPYDIDGGQNILEMPLIRQFIRWLQVIYQLQQGSVAHDLYEVMLYEWLPIDPLVAMQLAYVAGKKRSSIREILDQPYGAFTEVYKGIAVSEADFAHAQTTLDNWQKQAVAEPTQQFMPWLQSLLNEATSILSSVYQSPQQLESALALNTLLQVIQSWSASSADFCLRDCLQMFATLSDHNLAIQLEDMGVKADAVRLSTAHKAKGQEWEYVFVVGCYAGKWGSKRVVNKLPLPESILETGIRDAKIEADEDDRRLLYVALTRAKKQVFVSYPRQLMTDTSVKQVTESMFISELQDLDGATVASDSAPELEQQPLENTLQLLAGDRTVVYENNTFELAPRKVATQQLPAEVTAFFKHITAHMQLSVSALNAYLHDPNDFVMTRLLRVPSEQPEYFAFGTAIHQALEFLNTYLLKHNEKPSLESFIEIFSQSLQSAGIASASMQERLKYGQNILSDLYQRTSNQHNIRSVEQIVGGLQSRAVLEGTPLLGRLDRVDWLDRQAKRVTVIDYKTGTPKSENELLAKTKSAEALLTERERSLPEHIRSSYQRQMVFYKLITELDNTFDATVAETSFVFVEPNSNGSFFTRDFTVSEEAVADLKKLIIEVMQEIQSLVFLEDFYFQLDNPK